jgi:hypothetical protein
VQGVCRTCFPRAHLLTLPACLFCRTDGAITNFFLAAAADSDLFGHQLIWALNSEARPPEEAFNPEVKR